MYWWSKKRENQKFRRRGQFTLFIIVGMVIFSVFAFALYARAKIITAQLNAQGEKQIKEYIDRNSIAQYVTGCLDAVSEEVIVRAMLQGGTFNFSGQIENEDYIEYYDAIYNRTINVSIIEKPNLKCPYGGLQSEFIVYPEPTTTGLPDYPYACGYASINSLKEIYSARGFGPCRNRCITWSQDFDIYSGFFGVNNLKRLCNNDGSNKVLEDESGSLYTNRVSCDYYSNDDKSLQKYIEEEMDAGITKCLNFTEILRRSPSNITVNDSPRTEVRFRSNGLSVKVVYPFTITLRNRQPITRLMDFSVEKDIAFKELYEYTYELVNYDVKKAEFDIVNNRMNVLSRADRRLNSNMYTSNYIVELIRGNSSNNFTDIIRVIDEKHKLRNLPLVINMGFINRRPVLDYIHLSKSQLFDIMAVENDTIELNPVGYDPDDDYIKYEYGFWREDYVDEYNISDDDCKTPNNMNYVIENCTIIDVTSDAPYNWTNSSIYKSTSKNATYKVTAQDVGFHKVKVTVRDMMHNLDDYQVVRILVFDLPKADIKGDNFYSDISDEYASYEDMYVLNGSDSLVSVMASALGYGFSSFVWLDQIETFDRSIPIFGPEDKALFFPNATTMLDAGATILNITEYIFRNKSATSTIHNISLTVIMQTVGLSNTAYYGVNVTPCLPHRDANPPYPYNEYSEIYGNPDELMNILQADHACCTDDMTYELDTKECYNKAMYGMITYFPDYTSASLRSPANPYSITYKDYGDITITENDAKTIREYTNDVFKQNFTRYCTGDRGNICTGIGEETRSVFKPCDDTNNGGPYAVERCSGPADITVASSSEMDCTKYYDGNTFEYQMGYPGATGLPASNYCTGIERQYSDGIDFGQGKYVCHGYCNPDGDCKPGDCRCSYNNYNLNSGGNSIYLVDIDCDGLPTYSTFRDSCKRDNNRRDRCSNCVLVASSVCESDFGCGASIVCNEQPVGASSSQVQRCDGDGSKGVLDHCTSACQAEDDASLICAPKTSTNQCTTDTNCNHKEIYHQANSGNSYCDYDCQNIPCVNNFKIIDLGTSSVHCATSCSTGDNHPVINPNHNDNCIATNVCCTIGPNRCGSPSDHTCIP